MEKSKPSQIIGNPFAKAYTLDLVKCELDHNNLLVNYSPALARLKVNSPKTKELGSFSLKSLKMLKKSAGEEISALIY